MKILLINSADIQGTILFSNDTTYWQANSFKFGFQNATSFWQFGGEDVFIYVSLYACQLTVMLTEQRVVELSMAMDRSGMICMLLISIPCGLSLWVSMACMILQ
jgi:hypothetical protein